MTEQKIIFEKNIERVESIANLYSSLKEANQRDTKDYTLTDILRAATVLLHSSFEEYFRSVLIQWLPTKADDNTLKDIPIALHAGNKRSEKIYLNVLSKYREKTIDEVIRQSVEEHLNRKSFNSQEDIKNWLSKVGINGDGLSGLEMVDKAVKRRHKIVHEADTDKSSSRNHLLPIKSKDVVAWISAYQQLVNTIDQEVELWEKKNG